MVRRGTHRDLRLELLRCEVEICRASTPASVYDQVVAIGTDIQGTRACDREAPLPVSVPVATSMIATAAASRSCWPATYAVLPSGVMAMLWGWGTVRLPGHLVGGGVDSLHLVGAEAGDEHLAAVRGDGQAVGHGADVDGGADLVVRGVDHRHGRVTVAAGVDPAAVGRDHQAVGAGRDRDGAQQGVGAGVDDAHGVVLEEADIGFGARCRGGGRGARRDVAGGEERADQAQAGGGQPQTP